MSEAAYHQAMHVVDDEGPIKIRVASRKDLATFRGFFKALIIEQAGRGAQIADEERTLACLYEPLFSAYTSGERRGVCLMAGLEQVSGVLLWGEPLAPLPVTLRDGPVAQGWGVYVVPSARGGGLSKRLRGAAAKILKGQGFQRVLGTAVVPESVRKAIQEARPQEFAALESALGAGFVWQEATGSLNLYEGG